MDRQSQVSSCAIPCFVLVMSTILVAALRGSDKYPLNTGAVTMEHSCITDDDYTKCFRTFLTHSQILQWTQNCIDKVCFLKLSPLSKKNEWCEQKLCLNRKWNGMEYIRFSDPTSVCYCQNFIRNKITESEKTTGQKLRNGKRWNSNCQLWSTIKYFIICFSEPYMHLPVLFMP